MSKSAPLLGRFPRSVKTVETPMALADVTFIGGRHLPGHRWYKLRPSFAPALVETLYESIATEATGSTLDPFSGAGTTVLTSKAEGIPSVGIELNPFLARLTQYSSDWSAPGTAVMSAAGDLEEKFCNRYSEVSHLDLEDAEVKLGVDRPHIHNVLRWWRPDVLVGLLTLKSLLLEAEPESIDYRLLWLTLSTVCIDVANIKRLHPTLTFFDRSGEHIDIEGQVVTKLRLVSDDLATFSLAKRTKSKIIQGDSLRPETYPKFTKPVALITSPPYANRYSYVWETRPHLYMMDLIEHASESGDLDLKAPGGTWGQATAILTKEEAAPRTKAIARTLAEPLRFLRDESPMMRNYVLRYFNMMGEHFETIAATLPVGSTFAYVVGNSRIKGADVDTQGCLVAQMLETDTLKPDRVIVFRRRIGRRDLFEVAITGSVV